MVPLPEAVTATLDRVVSVTQSQSSKRDDLIRATREVIAEQGLRGLRVEDVAQRVGVANSLVYYHFGTRADLLSATLDDLEASSPSTKLLQGSEPAYSQLQSALLSELSDSSLVRANAIVWAEFATAALTDDGIRQRVAATSQLWNTAITECIRRGQRDGSIRADIDVEELTLILNSLVEGINLRSMTGAVDLAAGRSALEALLNQLLPAEASVEGG